MNQFHDKISKSYSKSLLTGIVIVLIYFCFRLASASGDVITPDLSLTKTTTESSYNYECNFRLIAANGTYTNVAHSMNQTPEVNKGSISKYLASPSDVAMTDLIAQGTFFIMPFRTKADLIAAVASGGAADLAHYLNSLLAGLRIQVTISAMPVSIRVRSDAIAHLVEINPANFAFTTGSPFTLNVHENAKEVANSGLTYLYPPLVDTTPADLNFQGPSAFVAPMRLDTALATYTTPFVAASTGQTKSFASTLPMENPMSWSMDVGSTWATTTFTWDKHGVNGVVVPGWIYNITVIATARSTGYYSSASGYQGPALYVVVPKLYYVYDGPASAAYCLSDVISDDRYLWTDTDPTERFVVMSATPYRSSLIPYTGQELRDNLRNAATYTSLPNLKESSVILTRIYNWGYALADTLP